MFEHKNLYPVVLVPGAIGYGEGTLTHKVFPYFGLTSTNYEKVIKSMGLDCHTADFELLSGTWDRACELYAEILGGTVDYGKAHSERNGHARYGKTYDTPMVKNWGGIDEHGEVIKINFIAHGFGAPVARLLLDLLVNGSEEERAVTPDAELSGLFRGGYTNLVHSITTIAGVNSGITIFEALEGRFPGAKKLVLKGLTVVEEIGLYKNFVDPYFQAHGLKLSQFGVSAHLKSIDGKKTIQFDEKVNDSYLKTSDNLFYDIGPWGMKLLNEKLTTFDNVYYLCKAGEVTNNIKGKIALPKLSAGITLPFSVLISTFENYLPEAPIITKRSMDNDGVVNTEAAIPPEGEEAALFRSTANCVPGVWYQMPIENRNHLSFRGLFIRPDKYRNEIYDLMKIICNLETLY